MTKTDAKAPTCTVDGNVEYYTCSECKKNFADAEGKTALATVVDTAKGHTEVVDSEVAPSCSATGLTEGKHCDACKEVLVKQETVAKIAHSFNKGKCSACGESDPDYKPPVTPETGDTTPVVALTFVMLMSVTALAVLLLCYKKRRA